MAGARQAWAAALALLFPLLSLVTDWGIGLAGFLFLATALCWWRDSRRALAACWPRLRWVVLAFLLDLGYMLCLSLVRIHDLKVLDRPLRMCLMLSAVPVVLVARPPARALWLGAAAGAWISLAFVAWQGLWLGVMRPGGLMNPITFGDLALCLALLSLAGALQAGDGRSGVRSDVRSGARGRWLAGSGVLAGLAASLLSGSRGGWLMLALLIALPALLAWRRRLSPRVALALPLLGLALAALAYALPQTGVRERIAIGVSDTRLYLAGDPAPTSLKVRLELWRAGAMLIREHPWTGLDTPAYKRRMHAWVAEGKLSPAVFAPPEPPHLHNDLLQVLVTRGVLGLAAWIGILLAPLDFFWTRLRQARARAGPPGPGYAAALAGLLLVLAYASFGLTEVIFWSMKANVFYALMVFLLVGWTLDEEALSATSPAPPSGAAADAAGAAAGVLPAHPETAPGTRASRPGSRAAGCARRRAARPHRWPTTAPARTAARRR
jgi:O-antigen ligase